MSDSTPRRARVERNIYRRADGRFEIGYRDSDGRQRWRVVDGGIMAARAQRDTILGAKGRGERVQPNPRLRFGDAADRWIAEQVAGLREATQASYENSVRVHLKPRWRGRRLDSITPDDVARLVRDLRAQGRAEWTIATVLTAASRVFKFARRRMGWHGTDPIAALDRSERPRVSQAARKRIFEGDELRQTLAAAREPWRTLFALAAVTGARMSELLGLVWSDLNLGDPDDATVSFTHQLSRSGKRVALKTDESRRTVELPRSLALLLLEHKARSPHSRDGSFAFAARSGRALSQRNATRALRVAMKAAVDDKGRPTFPGLQDNGAVPRGAVPTFHGFRHTAASVAIADGDVEEVSWQLGHKSSVITRAVYRHEVKDAERTARRRAKMEARYGPLLGGEGPTPASSEEAEVVSLDERRS
jgi:integrase